MKHRNVFRRDRADCRKPYWEVVVCGHYLGTYPSPEEAKRRRDEYLASLQKVPAPRVTTKEKTNVLTMGWR